MANKDYEQKKRECLQEFCKLHDCETPHDYIAETFSYAFDRAYALGKQEIKQEIKQEADAEETVISGWVAKDADAQWVYLYNSMPTRGINMWNGHGSLLIPLDANSFPDLTWESDPEPVEIIIKRKKWNI